MRTVLTIFYSLVLAIVTFIKATDFITRQMAKRHVRQIEEAKAYLAARPVYDTSITDKWVELEPYADWLDARIAGPSDAFGKHAQAVSDKEIDDLTKDCTALSKEIRTALRHEHRIYRRLSRSDQRSWPDDIDSGWHSIYHRVSKIKFRFKRTRLNLARIKAY